MGRKDKRKEVPGPNSPPIKPTILLKRNYIKNIPIQKSNSNPSGIMSRVQVKSIIKIPIKIETIIYELTIHLFAKSHCLCSLHSKNTRPSLTR